MAEERIRVRFAPSPTGALHIGNVRAALFNWLVAKHKKGTFILRIEDTDIERGTEASITEIVDSLKWLGLEWDEGYAKGGLFGPYRQTERLDIYNQYAKMLFAQGKAYYCYCTEEELENKRHEALKKGEVPRYDGRCKFATENEIKAWKEEGRKSTVRLKLPIMPVLVKDIVKGKVEFATLPLGDFVLMKSNGTPSYNFACVIDDHFMQISHVIRGEDHFTNTARQLMLYQIFKWVPPQFAHLPLIFGADKTPLSKRHGAVSLKDFKEKGFFKEALINYMALLGWSHKEGKEIMQLSELVNEFSLERVTTSPAMFDIRKLEWMNAHYIKEMDLEKLAKTAMPFVKSEKELSLEWFKEFLKFTRESIHKLDELQAHFDFLMADKVDFDNESSSILEGAGAKEVLEHTYKVFLAASSFDEAGIKQAINKVQEETKKKGKELFLPIRATLTGKLHGPELVKFIPLLGKEKTLSRLKFFLK